MTLNIPIINLAGLYPDPFGLIDKSRYKETVNKIGKACREEGFFYLTCQHLDARLTLDIFELTKKFFDLPLNLKQRWLLSQNTHQGYGPIGEENLSRSNHDNKETFDLFNLNHPILNEIDEFIPEFSLILKKYYRQTRAIGIKILEAMAVDLGMSDETFTQHFGPKDNDNSTTDSDATVCRLIHYPSSVQKGDTAVNCRIFPEIIAGSHTDYGCLTLLNQDEVGGLQVFDNLTQQFIDVDPLPGTLIANVGDLMSRWTNNIYKSAQHRVIRFKREQNRYSIPIFVEPHPDTLVKTLTSCIQDEDRANYSPITSGDYIKSRFCQTYNYLGE